MFFKGVIEDRKILSISYGLKYNFRNTKNWHVKEVGKFETSPFIYCVHGQFKPCLFAKFLLVEVFILKYLFRVIRLYTYNIFGTGEWAYVSLNILD